MEQLKYIETGSRQRIRIGQHHDRSEGWAREPRLSPVVDLNSRWRDIDRVQRVLIGLLLFTAGYVLGFMVWG